MKLQEILNHNKEIKETVFKLKQQIENLDNYIIAPCQYCPYDGVYRCEACQSDYFEGFNIKDFPY